MSLNDTPTAERVQIGFFGLRNAGKSSLVNRITEQEVSLVSEVKGTTTDPVKKSMELLPLGPVTLIDTPGFDDEGSLGDMRVRRTREVIAVCDLAVLVTEHESYNADEKELERLILEREIPCIRVRTKTDLKDAREQLSEERDPEVLTEKRDPEGLPEERNPEDLPILVSSKNGTGIRELKERMAHIMQSRGKKRRFVADLIRPGDTVVLVIPIDSSAPRGRLILPQQMAIRDILDAGALSLVTGVEELPQALKGLTKPPTLVITDSQAFGRVAKLLPEEIPLTSFSILMARYKGFLKQAVAGADVLDRLPDKARILISEGCTHHRQCEDIGTVKLPKWIREYTGIEPEFTFTGGHAFPEQIRTYDLIIHCGACMLTDREVQNRMERAEREGVPFTNYGTAIARMHRILDRSLRPLAGLLEEE